ncbi:hypothetical protein SK128_003552 [Halocaridina rubra]|uniref:RING-type E3 ubiquitin transferase n=1 Tax=Halocaridina rubra TaxID=373956 RepID=A0AAN8WU79_HALRR
MASKRRLNYAELAYEDVVCPICLSILIEPVTMPCWHSLCRSCFTLHVQETSLECPLCRMRISVWVRRNSKTNSIVNNRLWTAIKENFPAKVEARLQGREDSDEEEYAGFEPKVCAPGEIKQEYEALVQQEIREQASRKSQEEELSNQLIQQLQEEERCKLRHHKQTEERLCKEDEILAKKIKEAEDTVLQEKLRHLRMVCGNDEEVARQIEVRDYSQTALT